MHGRIAKTIENVNSHAVTIYRDNLLSGMYFIRTLPDDNHVTKVIIR